MGAIAMRNVGAGPVRAGAGRRLGADVQRGAEAGGDGQGRGVAAGG